MERPLYGSIGLQAPLDSARVVVLVVPVTLQPVVVE